MAKNWALKYPLIWCLVNVPQKVIKQVRQFSWTKYLHSDKQRDGNSDTKIHSLVTLEKATDILVWFYCHGIRDKLCIWHNTMLIWGRAWWRWNAYLLLMNVNLTEALEIYCWQTAKKQKGQKTGCLGACRENWTETSLFKKQSELPKTFLGKRGDFKSVLSRLRHIKFPKCQKKTKKPSLLRDWCQILKLKISNKK